MYGPRTTLYVAASAWNNSGDSGVREFTLSTHPSSAATWTTTRRIQTLGSGKLFAPANLRCTQDNAGYSRLIAYYLRERYTLRYTGGMVPDVTQMLVKGHGVFASPASTAAPAKLRLLYEVAPMAFLIESAGGRSSDGAGSVLLRVVRACDERTAVCLGSAEEVARFEAFCGAGAT